MNLFVVLVCGFIIVMSVRPKRLPRGIARSTRRQGCA